MTADKRLIEVAFPLEATSLDSVHEKNMRHGHISTLHIWPARRPLAACRAAIIATLLPDPGNDKDRNELLTRLGGRIEETVKSVRKNGRVVEQRKRETIGGILHWGRENGADLKWFRDKIADAHGGRAPRVLDPFSGGGTIPLEAARLGCEAIAMDVNPVAWTILRCTLEFPQRFAGVKKRLPDHALKDREFMEAFFTAQGYRKAHLQSALASLGFGAEETLGLDLAPPPVEADLAWHMRAWGRRVLHDVRNTLGERYPVYADFEPLKAGGSHAARDMVLVPSHDDGSPDVDKLNAEFSADYLANKLNSRWLAKPTVAYLWAKTVICRSCRASVPLLKTRWICKKDKKRVVLEVTPRDDKSGVTFSLLKNAPQQGGNATQHREHDRKLGEGTMTKRAVLCPCCGLPMTMEEIRQEATAGRVGAVMTAVVVDGPNGKEYRLPTELELAAAVVTAEQLAELFSDIPYGLPYEQISPNRPSPNTRGASGLTRYGVDSWGKVFSERQLYMMGSFTLAVRRAAHEVARCEPDGFWCDALRSLLACAVSRLADRGSNLTTWQNNADKLGHTFTRWALSYTWDYAEGNPYVDSSGGFLQAVDWVAEVTEHTLAACKDVPAPEVTFSSCLAADYGMVDAVITDPPYYDAIPYSDLMDFFHVWLRRILGQSGGTYDAAFEQSLGPKWDMESRDGELVDQPGRFGANVASSRANYEDGMARVFTKCHTALKPDGRMVVVFANKSPTAWETLVSALVRAGFVVDGSWPIQTERQSRTNALSTASLASSIWLVCKKRLPTAQQGWDVQVLDDMRLHVTAKLREYWDAGIRGPDFIWAALGPALEVFSRHPVVFKANVQPKAPMTVSEFLGAVRRLVIEFIVGQVLAGGGAGGDASGLDDVTIYYLLHRNAFKLGPAPIGAVILYALSCNVSDSSLVDAYDLLTGSAGSAAAAEADDESEVVDEADEGEEEIGDEAESSGGGNTVKLKPWDARRGRNLGVSGPGGRPAPRIDLVHKLMQLWRAGDEAKVDEYLERNGLWRDELFHKLLQALTELAEHGSDERSILESVASHIVARAGIGMPAQSRLV